MRAMLCAAVLLAASPFAAATDYSSILAISSALAQQGVAIPAKTTPAASASPAAAHATLAGAGVPSAPRVGSTPRKTIKAAPAARPAACPSGNPQCGCGADCACGPNCPCQGGQDRTHARAAKPRAQAAYPSRSMHGDYWSGPTGGQPSRSHLAAAHGFDPAWLASLSQQQLNALHADAHDGTVRSAAVYKTRTAAPQLNRSQPRYMKMRQCDGHGHCRDVWVRVD